MKKVFFYILSFILLFPCCANRHLAKTESTQDKHEESRGRTETAKQDSICVIDSVTTIIDDNTQIVTITETVRSYENGIIKKEEIKAVEVQKNDNHIITHSNDNLTVTGKETAQTDTTKTIDTNTRNQLTTKEKTVNRDSILCFKLITILLLIVLVLILYRRIKKRLVGK